MDEKNLELSMEQAFAQAEELPALTLDPFAEKTEEAKPETAQREIVPIQLNDTMLSEAEKKVVRDFAEKIDITNSNMVLQYGADAQKKLAAFSESALGNARTKDLGEVGNMLSGLIVELKGFDTEEDKGLFGMFKKQVDKITAMKAKYDKIDVNVEKIAGMLEEHQITLFKDIAVLDQMYEKNLANFKELTMYILAGKKRLEKALNEELPALTEKAQKSGLPEDAQAANDFASMCNRFEKKLHDLELTRMISVQMSPQIRLVQNNDTLMAEKIQTTLTSTLPLWKSQMLLALGIEHSNQAIKAQREVTNMTNELLRKNAETLKMGTIGAAKESERGIVDIETLKNTNRTLIDTLDEVLKIQTEGREKRRAAEIELGRIEGELKQKLLEINSK